MKRNSLGWCRSDLNATEHPTTLDIGWAAGIYEGEGTVSGSGKYKGVRVVQKDPWILTRLQHLFGGSVRFYENRERPIWAWAMSGARARGFLMTVYKFLSPRRKAQALLVLTPKEAQ